jgi:AcrR family transcriptional regulator
VLSPPLKARSAKVAHLPAGRPPRGVADARRQEREDELLRAAAVVLARRGVRSTSMDALADDMGIPKSVLYRYFGTREALLAAILGGFAAQMRALQSRPWRGLGRNLREVVALARANRSEFLLITRHCPADPEYRCYFEDLHTSIVERTDVLLKESSHALSNDATLRQLSSHATAGFLIDAVLWWVEQGDAARDDDFVAWTRRAMDTMYAGWQARPEMRPTRAPTDASGA